MDDREMVDRRGTAPRATILQGSSAPLCAARALSWFRSTLSCSSGRRFHQISLQGELERPVGYDPTSSAWRAETLPLSYGRVVGRGRIRTSEPRRDGVYGAAALASCIPARTVSGGPNRTDFAFRHELMRLVSARCLSPQQKVSGFSSPDLRADTSTVARELADSRGPDPHAPEGTIGLRGRAEHSSG